MEQRNQTLVEAARTMLIFSRAPLFLWAEVIATARKPDISFLHVFEALCNPKNDREDIGKLGAKGDIGFFIGYYANSCAYRVMRYFSFGRHLEELHVTWAHLEKKQRRLRTYTNIAQEFLYSGWRRRHKYNVTPSQR
ncbi:hypothetical protein Tco_1512961 [Tanacetum coccineum]